MLTGTVESPTSAPPTTAGRVADAVRRAAHASHHAHLLKSIAADTLEDAKYSAARTVKRLERRIVALGDAKDELALRIRRRPLQSIAIAAGAGVVAGLVAGWVGRVAKRAPCALLAAAIVLSFPPSAAAQRHHPGPRRPGAVVFVGGYFYDPFFGPYPWWLPTAYPHPYYPVFDDRAEIRVQVQPKQAAVFVDGYYAGTVDDFDGFFERLPVTPGAHTIDLYLEGYRTVRQPLYVGPNSTYSLRVTMIRIGANERSDPPPMAPALPPPPPGTARLPRTYPGPMPAPPAMRVADLGTLSIRFQPDDAEVVIDGESWNASTPGDPLVVQLPDGSHRVEIVKAGYRRFVTDVLVKAGGSATLNVSLTAEEKH